MKKLTKFQKEIRKENRKRYKEQEIPVGATVILKDKIVRNDFSYGVGTGGKILEALPTEMHSKLYRLYRVRLFIAPTVYSDMVLEYSQISWVKNN